MSEKEFDPNIGKETQIKPGEVRNPHGAPKGKRLSTLLKETLSNGLAVKVRNADGTAGTKYIKEADIISALIQEAVGGKNKMNAIKEILDRVDGKAFQSIDITSAGEKFNSVLTIEVVSTKENAIDENAIDENDEKSE